MASASFSRTLAKWSLIASVAIACADATADKTLHVALPIAETSFDVRHPTPPGQKTVPVGTGMMAFHSCTAATFNYTFTGGTSAGLSSTINLIRVGPVPPGCTS